MKRIIIGIILLATTANAGSLVNTSNGTPIQGFSPNGLASSLLTVNSTWFDMTNYVAFSATAPADCKIRLAATQSKTGTVSEPVYGGQWNTLITNPATPWVNYSGCTNGNLRR